MHYGENKNSEKVLRMGSVLKKPKKKATDTLLREMV